MTNAYLDLATSTFEMMALLGLTLTEQEILAIAVERLSTLHPRAELDAAKAQIQAKLASYTNYRA